MIAETADIIHELRNNNRKLEDDLNLARGEIHLMRIITSYASDCRRDCDNCKDRHCRVSV